jgi:hypothetical protein
MKCGVEAQRRQSAKLFLHSLEMGLPPTPHPRASMLPSPPWFRGEGLAFGRGDGGGGGNPIPTRGHALWYSMYICTLCVEGYLC